RRVLFRSKLNKNISHISEEDIEYFLENKNLNLAATTQSEMAYKDADVVIIATPTNYDPDRHYFDTKSVESVINEVLKINTETIKIGRAHVPIGYTEEVRQRFKTDQIIFSPEFL